MGVLKRADRERIRHRLAALPSNVTLVHFTQEKCWPCTDRSRALLEEITAESHHLHLRFVDFAAEPEMAERLGVNQVPATVIAGPREAGLRFDGLPEGAELDPFLDGIAAVAEGVGREHLAVLASPPTRDVVLSQE